MSTTTDLANVSSSQQGAMVAVSQSREIAEIQGAMTIAKRFPRDQKVSLDRILVACRRKGLAEKAVYMFVKGKTEISGPSIRLAETLAREWGNLQFGVREIEQRNGESTVEAYALDLETNVKCSKVFQVRHFRDTKSGGYAINDQREIYELVANQGSRRMRACILGLLPGDIVEAAVEECEKTLKTGCEETSEETQKLLDAFDKFQVTKEMIENRIQRNLESITSIQIVDLRKIYNSLKDGMSKPSDWFVSNDPNKSTSTVRKNASL